MDFDPPTIPDKLKTQLIRIVSETRQRGSSGWTDELAEVVVERVLQNQGYFKSQSRAEAKILSDDTVSQHVSITFHIDLGVQYRLQSISFRSAQEAQRLVFSQDELRKTIPITDGGIFNVSRIRGGLDSLKNLYGSHGYIDFVARPETTVDDGTGRIFLAMILDQQRVVRIGKVSVITREPKVQALVESKFKPGDIVDGTSLVTFFELNKSDLPPGASLQDVDVVRRDVKAGIADLNFNLLTCSEFHSSLDP